MKHERLTDEERHRRADSVLRCIRATPGLSAGAIGRRLGDVSAREVRERIRRLRTRGVPVIIGVNGQGYYYLPDVGDEQLRAEMVKAHRGRTREYMLDHAVLMRQIGEMTAEALGEQLLFDLVVPVDDGADGPVDLDALAAIPAKRRAGFFRVLTRMLDRIGADPEAFAVERAYLADRFGRVFMPKASLGKLAQARRLLEEAGV